MADGEDPFANAAFPISGEFAALCAPLPLLFVDLNIGPVILGFCDASRGKYSETNIDNGRPFVFMSFSLIQTLPGFWGSPPLDVDGPKK